MTQGTCPASVVRPPHSAVLIPHRTIPCR